MTVVSEDVDTRQAIGELDRLAVTTFRERGADFDRAGVLPLENLEAVHRLGLLHATVSTKNGGLGGSLFGENPSLFLDILRTICHGDGATGHCYQLHNHTLWSIEADGTPDQIERFLKPAIAKFSILASVGSEPGRTNMYALKTRARKVSGGWVVNGVKNFVTNGAEADFTVVATAMDGNDDPANNLMFIIERDRDGVTWDDTWYRPNGMRAARSPIMTLNDVFVPDANLLGEPGTYKKERWQGRFHLGFTANYLGSAEGLYDWYLQYMRQRGKAKDGIVQLRTGEMRILLDGARALFNAALESWQRDSVVDAELRSMSAKSAAANAAFQISRAIIYTAGATAQFDEHPLSRFVRNIEQHVVHAGHDRTAQILGQADLGESFDSTLQR